MSVPPPSGFLQVDFLSGLDDCNSFLIACPALSLLPLSSIHHSHRCQGNVSGNIYLAIIILSAWQDPHWVKWPPGSSSFSSAFLSKSSSHWPMVLLFCDLLPALSIGPLFHLCLQSSCPAVLQAQLRSGVTPMGRPLWSAGHSVSLHLACYIRIVFVSSIRSRNPWEEELC